MGRTLTQTNCLQLGASARLRLISTELDLAITFCMIATTTSDQARFERNITHAERAYALAINYLDGGLNSYQNSEIREKLTRLESLLKSLGRHPRGGGRLPPT